MPRGKKTSVIERSKWRREYDESGKTLEDIAKEAGRAISTVSKGIERARAEEDIKRVKIQQLGDAYQLHTSDLLYTARIIQNADSTRVANRPQSLGAIGYEMLLEGLRSHIHISPLWRADRDRKNQTLRMAGLRRDLEPHIGTAVDQASELSTLVSREGFRKSLGEAVDAILAGGTIESFEYKNEDHRKYWAAIQISVKSTDDNALQTVEEIHRRVLQEVVKKVPLEAYEEANKERDRAQRVIDQEVEMLTLRRVVPGDCNLCPRF